MADIAITPANVVPSTGGSIVTGTSGDTITAGDYVYLDNTNNVWMLAVANATALKSGSGTQYGIAVNGASPGQPISVCLADPNGIAIGGVTVVGTIYCVSAAAGGICPWADLVATNYVTIIGVGMAGNKIKTVTGGATGLQHA